MERDRDRKRLIQLHSIKRVKIDVLYMGVLPSVVNIGGIEVPRVPCALVWLIPHKDVQATHSHKITAHYSTCTGFLLH